jgi:hypothetical protein
MMANLINSMFLLPDRLAVQGGEMYVRFPTESIPLNKSVRSIWLHLSLTGHGDPTVLQIREVESPWDENVFHHARPHASPRLLMQIACLPHVAEDAAAIDMVMEKWLYRKENYGLKVSYMYQGSEFDLKKPPYLEVIYEPAYAGSVVV